MFVIRILYKIRFSPILDIFTVKRRLRDYRREMGKSAEAAEIDSGLMGRSGKVVLMAVAM